MRRFVPILVIAVAAVIAGCGSSSSSSTSTTSATSAPATTSSSSTTSSTSSAAPGGAAFTLTETEFKITPATKTIAKGGMITITVKNAGAVVHALTVNTPAGPVSTGNIAPGASTTLTVDATNAGHYTLFCPIDSHRQLGMVGTLIVGASTASSGGAPVATSSSSGSGSGGGGYGAGGSGY
jgi:uncharacterized cupredoxin-like copper-binding protein